MNKINLAQEILKTAIDEYNEINVNKIYFNENAELYGANGVLDSLGLVSLIVIVEEIIENKLSLSITLANDKAFSQSKSPFSTINSFINYVDEIINEELENA